MAMQLLCPLGRQKQLLHIFAFMQPGDKFIIMGHTLSKIYFTNTDVAMYHGKVVLFTVDWHSRWVREPIITPPNSTFEWKQYNAIINRPALVAWYVNNSSEYGPLWAPTGMVEAYVGQKFNEFIPWLHESKDMKKLLLF
jgi:hypothetical protein